MSNLRNLRYWFEAVPGEPNLLFWKIVFSLAGLVVIGAVVAVFMARRHKHDGIRHKIWYKFSVWGFSAGLVSLLLGFFRFQNAYLLSMRLWIFAWIAIAVVWFLWILRYVILVAPKRLKEREEKRAYGQYLPKRG